MNFGKQITETCSSAGTGCTPVVNPFGPIGAPSASSPPLQFSVRARYEFAVGDYQGFVQASAAHSGHWFTQAGANPPTAPALRRAAISVLLVAALGVAGSPAFADLHAATAAYKSGDFTAAFAEFKGLAELGQPMAQYDLAIMYARGEGVALSNTHAHTWASLASSNGEPRAAALRDELAPNLTPTSLQISAELQAKYDRTALEARLMPRLLEGREFESRDPVRRLKPYIPDYPLDARRRGIQGEVYVEFVVAPDGRPRLPRILYAVPAHEFDAVVRDSVMHSEYLPGRVNGQPVATPVSVFYNFKMDFAASSYEGLERRVKDTLAKAESGDPSAEMLYAMMIAGLPQLRQSYDKALPWFLKAAQAGAPYAQYQIGTGLLLGRGCQCDAGKGEIWLEKAAQSDQPDAQVSLAEYLLREKANEEAANAAVVWLERAARQGSNSAKLRLAAILAASPSAGIRDPSRALALTQGLDADYKHDPSLWEIRAAASATAADFKTAAKAQARAIDEAKELHWDLAVLNARQSAYASGQAWSGDLLAF